MPIVPDDEPTTIVPDEPPSIGLGDRLHNIREALDASVQGVVRGIPIVGPMLDRGVSAAVAAPMVLKPRTLTDVVADRPGGFAGAYNAIQSEADRVAAQHPAAATTGEVAGSLISTVPAARAFPKVFGGGTFLGQTGAGGVLGGTDAFIRSGGDLDAAKTGAAIGAAGPLMGQILAPLGQGIVSAGRAIKDYVPGVGKILQPRILPASAPELHQAAESGYQALSQIAPYNPTSLDALKTQIKQGLYNQSKSGQVGAVEAHRILDTLDSLPPTATSLHTIRKELGKVQGGDEGYSARFAKDAIDNFMANPSPGSLLPAAGNQATAAKILQDANANYRSAMNIDELRNRVTKAKLDAANSYNPVPFLAEGQAVRKQAKQMLDSNKASRFLLDNEREAITGIQAGSAGERLMRMTGSVSGTARPGAFTAVVPLLTGAYSGALPAAAGVAAGIASNAATSALTRRAVNEAEHIISANAPYSQFRMQQQLPPPVSMSPPPGLGPSSISPGAHRDEIARMLALQTEQQTNPGLRRIIIDTPSVEEQP